MEPAARRDIGRVRVLITQPDIGDAKPGLRREHRCKQCLGIGMRRRGFKEENGSWNTGWISRARSRRRMVSRDFPSTRISPPVGGCSPRISRARVDLPQPDSPTTPVQLPAVTDKDTPSTARTRRLPCGKCLVTSRISIAALMPAIQPAGGTDSHDRGRRIASGSYPHTQRWPARSGRGTRIR